MRRTLQKASVWAFSALFGCISLLGPGWHCFLGHAYHGDAGSHGCCAVFCADEHEHSQHGGHDHAHPDHADHHGPVAHGRGADEQAARPAVSALGDHDCPLCRFFAQAAWAGEAAPDELALVFVDETSPGAGVARRVHVASYQSRAPPTGAQHC